MNPLYRCLRLGTRFIVLCTLRLRLRRDHLPERPGGYILAVSHLSHLEPVCLSTLIDREIDWMTRKEFYSVRPVAWLLDRLNCFAVDRQGVPVSAIRQAIARVQAGRVVGIFPEGGVVHGPASVVRGGPIRKGVCAIAIRSGVPVVPCVVLGTHQLNCPWPWLPFKWGKLHVAYGEPIAPPAGPSNRQTREQLADQLRERFQSLYGELRARYQIADQSIP